MKTDIYVKSMVKRLDNLIRGSSPSVSKWDVIISNKIISQQSKRYLELKAICIINLPLSLKDLTKYIHFVFN